MTNSVSFTSRLLNYVEPYFIDGIAKTAFYTEVNTNIKKNDKVFITNGYYDSERYIVKGKWVKNADGYRVLYVDRCKIVLDIDYNSGYYLGLTQTYTEQSFDNYIKVYHIRSQREFDYINKLFIDSYTQSRVSKFEKNLTNNIIYSDKIYSGTLAGIGANNGLGTTKAFWARNGLNWINVSNQFSNNSFTFSSSYYAAGLTNSGRVVFLGEDINYGNKLFKEKNVYKHFGSANDWRIDTEYKQPIISKLNFREGVFKGIHNDGVFGTYRKSENWLGTQSSWNSGFFVNSNWIGGVMKSKSVESEASYYATIENGVPVQTTDFSNNKGHGYNYVIDSNVYSGIIENGNFINCNVGTYSNGLTAIDGYFGYNNTYITSLQGGLYTYCDINNTEMKNSFTLDSIVLNSYLENVKTLNTQLSESYSKGGEFSTSNAISIITADMYSFIPSNQTLSQSNIRGVLKLYISDKDYERLDTFDNFFITKINKEYILSSLNSDEKILLPYETRYVLDTFWDFKVGGVNQECIATLKTRFDNKNLPIVKFISGNYSNNLEANPNGYASIDIDLGQFLAFYQNDLNVVDVKYTYLNQTIIKKENVQNLFSNTAISNSDFRNGVIDSITWTSGANENYPSNVIKYENNKLKITKISANEILVYLNENKPTINDNQLKIGSYVWLDSIFHTDVNGSVTDLSGSYKISSYNSDQIILSNSTIINPINSGGTYSVLDARPNYASINKLLIDNSTINSGLFMRTLFKNSTFYNEEFNNNDENLGNSNVEKLRLVNQIFKSNNNTIKSGLIHKSHIMDVNWVSGISNNSIWMGATFGGGIFNNGIWENGTFQDGTFQNSKETSLSTNDYSTLTHYRNWFNGTFNNGFFYNSVWLNGTFNGGKLYNSNWYGGIWNNGILGDKNLSTTNTMMSTYLNIGVGSTQTFWYNGIVENAQIGGDGIAYWYGGRFDAGVFTSNGTNQSKESIWYGGEFNGGNFTGLARWKDGTFNKGKFSSYYGWTMSGSTYSNHYSWEKGKFNGGQFGIANYATNSTWFDGEFDGGIFQGRVWNNGIFQNGNFNGGSSYSAINEESQFTESFTSSYYGLWRNGWVTNIKHKALTDKEIDPNNLRVSETEKQKNAILKNILWVNGVFDHPNGDIENSIWLSGKFRKGMFKQGTFNPYVRRDWWSSSFGTYSTFNTSLVDCVWENGNFDGGNFYMSDWRSGDFFSGTMSGARWIDGVWHFGSAKNVYWDNGVWENGLWDGSPFDYNNLGTNNIMNPGKDRDMVLRISNVHRNGKLHLINAFTGSVSTEILADGNFSNINKFYGWTFSNTGLTSWVATYNGVTLPSSFVSSPSINTVTTTPGYTEYSIGTNVYTGDEYAIYISSNWGVTGYIVVTATPSDTDQTIAQKIADVINQGNYLNIVRYNNTFTNWSDLFGLSYPIYSYYLSGSQFSVSYPWDFYIYGFTTPVVISGNYSESEILYALATGLTTSAFTQSGTEYSISLTVANTGTRTDFVVYTGTNSIPETITGNVSSRTYNYKYTPINETEDEFKFGIKRVLYPNPDNSSTFTILGASIKLTEGVYTEQYNNKLYEFSTFTLPFEYGLTGTTVSLPSVLQTNISAGGQVVSLKFGNGAFKSGLWKGGYWNNGWRSIWNSNEYDYIIFNEIYDNYFIESSQNLWKVKLKAFTTIGDLKVGDKVSIGNIVCIDVNENRNLIRDFFRIIEIGSDYIIAEVSLNMPVRRIVKDSNDHMIYVTKNVWLSGVFHNGYFKGVWNYGKFKGYPYITKMEDTHWIDGIFDGGHYKSDKKYYQLGGQTFSYNSGVIQNFVFRDNNVDNGGFLYNSWMDVNYLTYSMVNLYKDNRRYDTQYGVIISDNNLRGYPVVDVLSSDSIFRNSYNLDSKYYKLGTKYKIYNDFIGDSSYFNYPLNTQGEPGVDEFLENEWEYSSVSTNYSSNIQTSGSDEEVLVVKYDKISYQNLGSKLVATFSMTYENGNNNINMNQEPDDLAGYTIKLNELGNLDANKAMSNISYTQTAWNTKFAGVNDISFNPSYITFDVGNQYPKDIGNTVDANRKAYVLNSKYFDFGTTQSIYEGYLNTGTFSSPLVTLVDSTNVSGTFSYIAYKAQTTTKVIVNTSIPFSFYANERYSGGLFAGSDRRGGHSIFRIVGVVEKCENGFSTSDDNNWKYVANTQIKLSMPNNYYYNYGIDRKRGVIAFDDIPPVFYGELVMDQSVINEIPLNEGDHLRFRIYIQTIRKMWASVNSGTQWGPGYMTLLLGPSSNKTTHNYTQNNQGFFEVIDKTTYINTSRNILNNQLSKQIEKFRYSIVDFDLEGYIGNTKVSDTIDQPTIYLLNDPPVNRPSEFPIINHAETGVPGNKKEYFYNRDSLQLFFISTENFEAKFRKISFLETDMIPFFVYATESNINNAVQVPLAGTSSTIVGTFKLD